MSPLTRAERKGEMGQVLADDQTWEEKWVGGMTMSCTGEHTMLGSSIDCSLPVSASVAGV